MALGGCGYANLNGIPTSTQPEGTPYFWRDPQGAWVCSEADFLHEIEAECLRLHDGLAATILET